MYQFWKSLKKWNKLGEKGCSYNMYKNLILKQLQSSKSKTLLAKNVEASEVIWFRKN